MPGRRCAISGCGNSKIGSKKRGENIIFHCFPKAKDLQSKRVLKYWIECCNRPDKFNVNTCTICSVHFKPDDYERDLKNELLGLPIKKRLKKTAVPSLFLGQQPDESLRLLLEINKNEQEIGNKNFPVDRFEILEEGNVENEIEVDMQKDEEKKIDIQEQEIGYGKLRKRQMEYTEHQSSHKTDLSNRNEVPTNDYFDLLRKYNILQKECHHFKIENKKLRRKNNLIKNQLSYYKNKYYNFKYNINKGSRRKNSLKSTILTDEVSLIKFVPVDSLTLEEP